MPIISPHGSSPLEDGRQSDRAMRVRRGVQRLLATMQAAHMPELPLSNGRRADLIALAENSEVWIIEIKSSVEDFNADGKWPDYRDFCDRFYFATLSDVPADIFPEECGFIVADRHAAEIVRQAPEHKLSAARRKAVTGRFARAAARRLYAAEIAADPNEIS